MEILDRLPLYEFHTMYYMLWKEKEEESKMTEEQKSAKAMGQAFENMV